MSSADKEVTGVAQIYRMDSGNAREAFDKFADTQEKTKNRSKNKPRKLEPKGLHACKIMHVCLHLCMCIYGGLCIYIYIYMCN